MAPIVREVLSEQSFLMHVRDLALLITIYFVTLPVLTTSHQRSSLIDITKGFSVISCNAQGFVRIKNILKAVF